MRVPAAVLLGVSVWRAALATVALTGFALYNQGRMINLVFLTQLGNLLCGVLFVLLLLFPIFTAGRRHEPRTGFLRGTNVVVMTIVMIVYMGPMGGDISEPKDLLCHLITPLLVIVDWLFVGRDQQECRWWHAPVWLLYPAGYLIFYTAYDPTFRDNHGQDIYPNFLEVGQSSFPGTVAALVGGSTLLAFVVLGLAKFKGALAAGRQQNPSYGSAPGYPPPAYAAPGRYVPPNGYTPPGGRQASTPVYPPRNLAPGYPPQPGYPRQPGYSAPAQPHS